MAYPIDSFEEPLYTLLSNIGLTEVTTEDYEVLAASDPATMQSYLEASAADPESYPWESVIYTLREMAGGAGETGEETAEAEAEAEGAEEAAEGEGEGEYAEGAEYAAEEGAEEGAEYDEAAQEEQYVDAQPTMEEPQDFSDGSWPCPRCSFVNPDAEGTVCLMCQTRRDAESFLPGGAFALPAGGQGRSTLSLKAQEVPNAKKFLIAKFDVQKFNPSSIMSSKKDRILEIDIFERKFRNCEPSGTVTQTYESAELYRIENMTDNNKALKVCFMNANASLNLEFPSCAVRQRFRELACLQRRNPVVWAPAFCRPSSREVMVTIARDAQSGKKATGFQAASFIASSVPYEMCKLWVGCINLQNRGLPLNKEKLAEFMPPQFDIYFVGLQDVPSSLRTGHEMTAFWTEFFGKGYFVLLNTSADDNRFAGLEGHRPDKSCPSTLLIVVRRGHLSKISNIECMDIVDEPGSRKEMAGVYSTFASLRIQENTFGVMVANITPNLKDVLIRNQKLQNMLGKIKCGDNHIDISARFDYFFIVGSLGYHTVPTDELHSQIAAQIVLTEFQECTILQEMCLPDRVLFWHRNRSCKATIFEYTTAPLLGMPNIDGAFDLFLQRPYLYALSPPVPTAKILINDLRFACDTLQVVKDSEVRITADWSEEGYIIAPLRFKSGKFDGLGIRPLNPITPAYEWLRAQFIVFSLVGIAEGISKKKETIASAIVPLRDLLLPNVQAAHNAFVMRTGTVIGLLDVNITYHPVEGKK